MKNALMAFAMLGLVTAVHAEQQGVYERTVDADKMALMQIGMGAVKARLKNPSSAEFRNVHFHRSSNGVPMTCGEVSSRDGLGDYGGFQKFISAGRSDLTLMESQMANEGRDFSEVWSRLCE